MRRAHDPSGLRGRRQRCCRHPQHQTGDAGGLGGQRQLATGDEIELPRRAPHFQHHDAHRIAGERIGRRPQRAIDIGGAHVHQPARIEPEFGQPAGRQRSRFNLGEILPDPDQRPAWRHPRRQSRDESGGRADVPALGKHFMHGSPGETALQRRIHARMAERHFVERESRLLRFEAFDAAAQSRKRAQACADHAPLPLKTMGRPDLEREQELAHLFMICSNIKPTPARESIGIGILVFLQWNQRRSRHFGARQLGASPESIPTRSLRPNGFRACAKRRIPE
jgi:hypothetical protein